MCLPSTNQNQMKGGRCARIRRIIKPPMQAAVLVLSCCVFVTEGASSTLKWH